MTRVWQTICISILGLFLAAFLVQKAFAETSEMKAVEQFVENAQRQPAHPIEPLPAFPQLPPHQYAASGLRSPFVPALVTAANAANQPDMNRAKEPLEAFSLDSLHMVGTLSRGNQIWGLVSAPGGIIYRVRQGNYIGKDYGKITLVTQDGIQFQETVPDGAGGWKKREATLSFSKQ